MARMHRKHRKGGHRKGKPLSAAHKKAISEALKRHHRGGGRKRRKHHTRHHATGHKRRRRRAGRRVKRA